jgi:hypothetical protein
MILTTLALGGSILGATAIAGLLMVYQIRQASNLGASTRSIYAADAGIEAALYQFFNQSAPPSLNFTNGASVTAVCTDAGAPIECSSQEADLVRAVGASGNVHRALELTLTF